MKYPIIIQLSGKQGSGKTTLAKNLQKLLTAETSITRYAKAVYEMHDMVLEVGKKYGFKPMKKDGPLLQLIGTEWGRKTRGEDVWIKACQCEVKKLGKAGVQVIIIEDCRFKNEFHCFPRSHKVRLMASKSARKARADSWRTNDQHPSETDLDLYEDLNKFDLMINTESFTSKSAAILIAKQLGLLMRGKVWKSWCKKQKSLSKR
jgi:energy-coupling factor transporter ATP-binding protein EcfA2